MSPDSTSKLQLEIGHVLFIDIVGYSKLLINEQGEVLRKLNQVVRGAEQVRAAEAANKLIRLPSGDGMALVFRDSPEAPAQCALEISAALKAHPEVPVRMGIHRGPVNEIVEVNERANIAGGGITIAQRVMDCGRICITAESLHRWAVSRGGGASGTGASLTSTKPSGSPRGNDPRFQKLIVDETVTPKQAKP